MNGASPLQLNSSSDDGSIIYLFGPLFVPFCFTVRAVCRLALAVFLTVGCCWWAVALSTGLLCSFVEPLVLEAAIAWSFEALKRFARSSGGSIVFFSS